MDITQSSADVILDIKIGLICGSGLDNPDILQNREEKYVNTPFGEPSDALILGNIGGVPCVLLARHGRKHNVMPSNVNFRANIWALKEEGCTHLLVTTACGSLQENIRPGDLVILDQFIDRTTKRHSTFYDCTLGGPAGVCHYPMQEPFCSKTRQVLSDVCDSLNFTHHKSGTCITIEGPRFSSRAESILFKSWGAHVINMTTVPEVVLANEAGLCYAAVAMATDYDCWRQNEASVSVDAVMATFASNSKKVVELILAAIPAIAQLDYTQDIKQKKEMLACAVMS